MIRSWENGSDRGLKRRRLWVGNWIRWTTILSLLVVGLKELGDWSQILFCLDTWVGDKNLKEVFPRLSLC
ncbi:hypothetical protein Lalb_Chr20g0116231 [Lupinus albus]|uniref:Uncharacterized protein n=1 Tax=Lupinus albus TaxID=3870 RepID=A0A6A4NU30_LUPAL|nr:hypothetical protein Lalb_Chr20g0116231 [Lupinus albus]